MLLYDNSTPPLFLITGVVKPAATGHDKLRPCQIWTGTKMPSDERREKAVLTAVDALQKSDDYFQRAKHIKDKFDTDEGGLWACVVKHEDDKSRVYFTYKSSNYIFFKVGNCYIALWQSSFQ